LNMKYPRFISKLKLKNNRPQIQFLLKSNGYNLNFKEIENL